MQTATLGDSRKEQMTLEVSWKGERPLAWEARLLWVTIVDMMARDAGGLGVTRTSSMQTWARLPKKGM